MKGCLRTRQARSRDDIRAFFDAIADHYRDRHGDPARLLAGRLALIRTLIGAHAGGVLLDVGCGPGVHLFPLAAEFHRVIGIDFAPRMIAAAARTRAALGCGDQVELRVAGAEDLGCLSPESVDVALCTGALEHIADKAAVLREVSRVLRPGGRFVCLTVNGDHLWYRWIAPRLGFPVKHLSTDTFVGARELRALLDAAGLVAHALGYWSFVARGDVPAWIGRTLQALDRCGGALAPRVLRGGLYVSAEKVGASTSLPIPAYAVA